MISDETDIEGTHKDDDKVAEVQDFPKISKQNVGRDAKSVDVLKSSKNHKKQLYQTLKSKPLNGLFSIPRFSSTELIQEVKFLSNELQIIPKQSERKVDVAPDEPLPVVDPESLHIIKPFLKEEDNKPKQPESLIAVEEIVNSTGPIRDVVITSSEINKFYPEQTGSMLRCSSCRGDGDVDKAQPFLKLTNPQTKSLLEIRFPEQHNKFKSSITVQSKADNEEIKLSYDRNDGFENLSTANLFPEPAAPSQVPEIEFRDAGTATFDIIQPIVVDQKKVDQSIQVNLESDIVESTPSKSRNIASQSLPENPSKPSTSKDQNINDTVETLSLTFVKYLDIKVNEMINNYTENLKKVSIGLAIQGSDRDVVQSEIVPKAITRQLQESQASIEHIMPLPDSVLSKNKSISNSLETVMPLPHQKDTPSSSQKTATAPPQETAPSPIHKPTSTPLYDCTSTPLQEVMQVLSQRAVPIPTSTFSKYQEGISDRLLPIPPPAKEQVHISEEAKYGTFVDSALVSQHIRPHPNEMVDAIKDQAKEKLSTTTTKTEPVKVKYPNLRNSDDSFEIQFYDSDVMSEGEIGYVYTSNSYSSGEIKPRIRTSSNSSEKSTDEEFLESLKKIKPTMETLGFTNKLDNLSDGSSSYTSTETTTSETPSTSETRKSF